MGATAGCRNPIIIIIHHLRALFGSVSDYFPRSSGDVQLTHQILCLLHFFIQNHATKCVDSPGRCLRIMPKPCRRSGYSASDSFDVSFFGALPKVAFWVFDKVELPVWRHCHTRHLSEES